VKFARTMTEGHEPNARPSFTETSYEMTGQIPGTVSLSNLMSRDVTTCKGCGTEWPCPTARALAELDGGAS